MARPRARRKELPQVGTRRFSVTSTTGHSLAPAMHALFEVPQSRQPGPEAPAAQPRPPKRDLLDGLNGPQRDAVTHEGQPLLIVAGAGSGKTKVLTSRIAYLLAARSVHPGEIIAITCAN